MHWLNANIYIFFHYLSPAESCGGVVQGLNGTIESPGFPHGYPNYANCTWLIITGERNRIQLTFVTLALEEDFDIVSVYDGQPSPGNLKMRLEIILLFLLSDLLFPCFLFFLQTPLTLSVWAYLFFSSSHFPLWMKSWHLDNSTFLWIRISPRWDMTHWVWFQSTVSVSSNLSGFFCHIG